MIAAAPRPVDAVERAAHLISTRGVEIVRCPPGSPGAAERTAPDHPVLYLVDPDAVPPPRWEELEDWIRLPTTVADLEARAARLLSRAEAVGAWWIRIDDDDVLRAGARIEPLSQMSAELLRVLLERSGSVVSRHELEARLWPEGSVGESRALDNLVRHLRQRVERMPIRIHTARARGFVLQRLTSMPDTAAQAS